MYCPSGDQDACLTPFAATNSDLWMNLAIGKRLSEGDFKFGVDPFSWASAGSYWANPSWLSRSVSNATRLELSQYRRR